MQDLAALEGKTILELREIAKVLGIVPSTMKKHELLNKIIAAATGDTQEEQSRTFAPAKRGRRPRMSSVRIESNTPTSEGATTETEVDNNTDEQSAPQIAPADETPQQTPKRRGRKPKVREVVEVVEQTPAEVEELTTVDSEEGYAPIEESDMELDEEMDDEMDDNEGLYGEEYNDEPITKDDFTAVIEGEGVTIL